MLLDFILIWLFSRSMIIYIIFLSGPHHFLCHFIMYVVYSVSERLLVEAKSMRTLLCYASAPANTQILWQTKMRYASAPANTQIPWQTKMRFPQWMARS